MASLWCIAMRACEGTAVLAATQMVTGKTAGGRVLPALRGQALFGRHSKRGPLAFVPNFMAFRRGLRDVRMVLSALVV